MSSIGSGLGWDYLKVYLYMTYKCFQKQLVSTERVIYIIHVLNMYFFLNSN